MEKLQNIEEINSWLRINRNTFSNVAKTNECRKWSKWVSRNERPFPCVCPARNDDCVFAEVYYEMTKIVEIVNFQDKCEEALLDYQTIKNDSSKVDVWLNQYASLQTKITSFSNNIDISVSHSPYETLSIEVDSPNLVNDFKAVYRDAIIKSKQILSFLNIFPIRAEYRSLEMQCRYIKKDVIGDYGFEVYRHSWDFVHDIYGLEPLSKPLFYFNANILSRVDYRFNIIHYKYLLQEVNKELPKDGKFTIDPFNNNKSAFWQYYDIAIELVQLNSSTIVLRISDYWQFYN